MTKILHTGYLFNYPKYGKFHYIIYRLDKIYAVFSHDNLTVETLSKIVSTIQDSANAVIANIFE